MRDGGVCGCGCVCMLWERGWDEDREYPLWKKGKKRRLCHNFFMVAHAILPCIVPVACVAFVVTQPTILLLSFLCQKSVSIVYLSLLLTSYFSLSLSDTRLLLFMSVSRAYLSMMALILHLPFYCSTMTMIVTTTRKMMMLLLLLLDSFWRLFFLLPRTTMSITVNC